MVERHFVQQPAVLQGTPVGVAPALAWAAVSSVAGRGAEKGYVVFHKGDSRGQLWCHRTRIDPGNSMSYPLYTYPLATFNPSITGRFPLFGDTIDQRPLIKGGEYPNVSYEDKIFYFDLISVRTSLTDYDRNKKLSFTYYSTCRQNDCKTHIFTRDHSKRSYSRR